MARAFLFVLDSFGIGGAADAAAFGDEGSDTFGHIAEACAQGRGDRAGLRGGPLELPNMTALGLAEAAALAPAGKAGSTTGAATGILRRGAGGVERQGHALRPLGDRRPCRCRSSGGTSRKPFRPSRATLTAALVREAGLPGILGDCHASGTEIIAQLRRGAHPQRQADLLHVGQFGASRSPRTRRISGSSVSIRCARSRASWSIR